MRNFAPQPAGRKKIAVSSSTGNVQLTLAPGQFDVRVCNLGTAPVAIRFGASNVTASFTTDMQVPAGAVEVLTGMTNDSAGLYVAAIAAGSTGDIEFTLGNGS